jgi:SAM-dependent methyltransferase
VPISAYFDPSKLEQESIIAALRQACQYVTGKVLDLGCGEQPYRHLFNTGVSYYLGADRSISSNIPPDVCADTSALPFKNSSFDAVLSTQVIEHVGDPFTMVREVARVLKNGGYLVLTGPHVWPLHEEPRDYYRYTRYAFELLSTRNMLDVVYIRERGGAVMAIAQMCSALLYETCRKMMPTRIAVKILLAPFLSCSRILDRVFFSPKLTLGYVVVAQKKGKSPLS